MYCGMENGLERRRLHSSFYGPYGPQEIIDSLRINIKHLRRWLISQGLGVRNIREPK